MQTNDQDGQHRPQQETEEEGAEGRPNWSLAGQHYGAGDQKSPCKERLSILAPVPARCDPIGDSLAECLRVEGYTEDEIRNMTHWEAEYLTDCLHAEDSVRCDHAHEGWIPIDTRDADEGYDPDPLEGRVHDWQARWLLRHGAIPQVTSNIWQLSAAEAQACIDAWPNPEDRPVRPCHVRYSREVGSVMTQADSWRTVQRRYHGMGPDDEFEITEWDRVCHEYGDGGYSRDHVLKVWAPRTSDQADEEDGRWHTENPADSGTCRDYSPPDRRYYVEVAVSQVRAERRADVEREVAETWAYLRERQKNQGSWVCRDILDAVEVRWFVCTGTERADRDAQIAATTAAFAADGVQRRPLVAIEYYTTYDAVPGRTLGFLGKVSTGNAVYGGSISRKTAVYLRALDLGTQHCHTPILEIAERLASWQPYFRPQYHPVSYLK